MRKMNTKKKNNVLEIVCFCLFCILTAFLSCFHEPWFDEFQAWGISKDTVYNILFVIPHYEGHPPLWHLILKIFSSLNFHPEIGIRIPNLLFMYGAVWLIIFKSPFTPPLKLLLPFTYFLFYQYSIVNRPYSIFCFAIFLSAVFYKERNEHPFRFIMALILLCFSSLYGMVIAAGIVFAWFLEIIIKEKPDFKGFIKCARFKAMLLIFFVCSALVIELLPSEDVFALSSDKVFACGAKILYSYLILPADALFYNFMDEVMIFYIFHINLSEFIMDFSKNIQVLFPFLLGCFLGLIVNLLLLIAFKKMNKLLLFAIPYLLFLSLTAGYIGTHHIGLLTVFIIAMFWYVLSDLKEEIKYTKFVYIFVIFCIIIQCYWSKCSFDNEMKYDYSASRKLVSYIKNCNMDKYMIMSEWLPSYSVYRHNKTKKLYRGKSKLTYDGYVNFQKNYTRITIENFYIQREAVTVNQYFGRNIFYNFNIDNPEKSYSVFKKMTPLEGEKLKEKLRALGVPEIIVGKAEIEKVFDMNELSKYKYIVFAEINFVTTWKDKRMYDALKIYVRDDIYNKLKNENKQVKYNEIK